MCSSDLRFRTNAARSFPALLMACCSSSAGVGPFVGAALFSVPAFFSWPVAGVAPVVPDKGGGFCDGELSFEDVCGVAGVCGDGGTGGFCAPSFCAHTPPALLSKMADNRAQRQLFLNRIIQF